LADSAKTGRVFSKTLLRKACPRTFNAVFDGLGDLLNGFGQPNAPIIGAIQAMHPLKASVL
jgi:hypothetical protein